MLVVVVAVVKTGVLQEQVEQEGWWWRWWSSGPGSAGTAGTANTGGGGGGDVMEHVAGISCSSGSGVVVVRFPGSTCASVAPGTNTLSSCVGPANDKVARFTVSGTLTI